MSQQERADIKLDAARRYHFVAIGGIGMSALALVLLKRGFRVSGSDAKDSPVLARLTAAGATVHVGHAAAHVQAGDVVVLSDAIKPDNPEWHRAIELGLPIISRAELMGAVSNAGQGVAVAGTHGKTTTSGMLASIFLAAEMDPTCLLGGELALLGGNARNGGPLTVVEACEAYESFLLLQPHAALITNIEVDHLDHHKTPEHLFESFRQFLRQVRGFAVLNGDDALLREMAAIPPRAVLYGAGEDADYRCTGITLGPEPAFTVHYGDARLPITLRVPGRHNVYNATGAAALALELGAVPEAVARGLAAFPGMHRRFERIGAIGEVAVVDDYAHHPTEIRATLAAARAVFPGRIVAVFQPHLYSRTRDLLDDFAAALSAADVVLVAPIYAAREAPISGVHHTQLVEQISALIPERPVLALQSRDEAVQVLAHAAHPDPGCEHAVAIPDLQRGDVIITIGAGDVDAVAHALTGL